MGMNPRGRSRGRNHNYNGSNGNNPNNHNGHNNHNSNNRRFGGSSGPSRNTVLDSSGPAGRLRGTAFQLAEKYLAAAKESMASDRVLAENCLQHADHFTRINMMAIASENRFNPQAQRASQPTAEEPVSVQAQDSGFEEVEQPAAAPEPEAKLDLSLPMFAIDPAVAAASETVEEKAAAPKRRGRPPRKPAVEAEGQGV